MKKWDYSIHDFTFNQILASTLSAATILKLFKWGSELSFRLILSATQCLGIIYKFSSKPEICIYYCKELLYCLIFCLACLPSDTLSKSQACDERRVFVLPAIHLITILPPLRRCSAHQTNSFTDCCKSALLALLISFAPRRSWLYNEDYIHEL